MISNHAFNDCRNFKTFVEKLTVAGFTLVPRASWRANVPAKVTGDNHVRAEIQWKGCNVVDVFLEGYGAEGFAIYFGSGQTTVSGEVEYVKHLAESAITRHARVEIALGEMARPAARVASSGDLARV